MVRSHTGEHHHGAGHDHADHGHEPPTLLSKTVSGLVCGLIFFVFCCVFSSMIFGNIDSASALTVGVGVHTVSMITGSVASWRISGSKAMMAGPDINPAVFMAEAATVIMSALCPDGVGSCAPDAREQLLPTVMMSVWIGSMLIGVSFAILGYYRLTRVGGFIPANVTAGFLSCIGYKVLKASVDVATGSPLKWKAYYLTKVGKNWRLLLPGLPIGGLLYVLKRRHSRYPAVYWPTLVLIPPVIFYIIVASYGADVNLSDMYASSGYGSGYGSGGGSGYGSGASGGSTNASGGGAGYGRALAAAPSAPSNASGTSDELLDEWRRANWLFPEAGPAPFWSQMEEVYGGLARDQVAWSSLVGCIPLWLVMVPVVCLDNLLQLTSTETALQVRRLGSLEPHCAALSRTAPH